MILIFVQINKSISANKIFGLCFKFPLFYMLDLPIVGF